METNEKLKLALVQETEKELLKMIEQVETIQEGDLQTLEQSMLRVGFPDFFGGLKVEDYLICCS
jgi:hypothetical protein